MMLLRVELTEHQRDRAGHMEAWAATARRLAEEYKRALDNGEAAGQSFVVELKLVQPVTRGT